MCASFSCRILFERHWLISESNFGGGRWIWDRSGSDSNSIRYSSRTALSIKMKCSIWYILSTFLVCIFRVEGSTAILRLFSNYFELILPIFSKAFFGYTETEQNRWHRKHIECGGKHQSPIAINSMTVSAWGNRQSVQYHLNRFDFRPKESICRQLNLFRTTIYCRRHCKCTITVIRCPLWFQKGVTTIEWKRCRTFSVANWRPNMNLRVYTFIGATGTTVDRSICSMAYGTRWNCIWFIGIDCTTVWRRRWNIMMAFVLWHSSINWPTLMARKLNKLFRIWIWCKNGTNEFYWIRHSHWLRCWAMWMLNDSICTKAHWPLHHVRKRCDGWFFQTYCRCLWLRWPNSVSCPVARMARLWWTIFGNYSPYAIAGYSFGMWMNTMPMCWTIHTKFITRNGIGYSESERKITGIYVILIRFINLHFQNIYKTKTIDVMGFGCCDFCFWGWQLRRLTGFT